MSTKNVSVQIRSYTLPELAKIYNVSPRGFRRWLLPHKAVIGDRVGHYFTPLQVKLIIESLGLPENPED
jgi:phage antirepressor YoqD-like protein